MALLTLVSVPMKEIVEAFTQTIQLNLAYYVSWPIAPTSQR
jgi:hypothetical protein